MDAIPTPPGTGSSWAGREVPIRVSVSPSTGMAVIAVGRVSGRSPHRTVNNLTLWQLRPGVNAWENRQIASDTIIQLANVRLRYAEALGLLRWVGAGQLVAPEFLEGAG